MKRDCLEAEFGEEPLVLSHLVTLFQLVLDLLARLLPQSRVAEAVLVDHGLLQVNIDGISGGHHVVEIANFDEWLDFASFGHLLLTHLLGYFEGISVDSGDEGVAVGALSATFVIILDDDGFTTSETPVKNQNNLSWLQEFSHDCFFVF